jgi:tetratricopeptide (TPR) repeat protein/transcriptional regulator with XRE-family HTH domain
VAHRPADFAEVLILLRNQTGWTQEELADRARDPGSGKGLGVSTISELERRIRPSCQKVTAERLANAFGLTGAAREVFVAVARGRKRTGGLLADGDWEVLLTQAARGSRLAAEFEFQAPGPLPGPDQDEAPDRPELLPGGLLVGRAYELDLLVSRMRLLAAGRGDALLIEGEPGIGKSALVRAAMARGDRTGTQVFWGGGDELGQALPLLPLLDALRVHEAPAGPRRSVIAGLLREPAADRGLDVLAVVAEQLLALIEEECAAGPTALVIDDLQWADGASLALWGRLARTARNLPLLLIGMTRPVPEREALPALRRVVGDTGRLRLDGLSRAGTASLVTALAGGQPDQGLLALAAGTAGNPLYLTELVAALARASSLSIGQAGTVSLVRGPVPGSLAEAIAGRLDFISGKAAEMLRAAALLGVNFALPDLATVTGHRVVELVSLLAEARAAGVLAETSQGLRFRHPLIRAALYDGIPGPVRTALHLDAARALAEAGVVADRVARQLLPALGERDESAEPLAPWILPWLTEAGAVLVSQAPQVAAELLRQATGGLPAGSVQRGRLTALLADALYRLGEVAEADQLARQSLATARDQDVIVDLLWTLAQCSMRVGRPGDALATLDRALAAPGLSLRHRARLLILAARAHSYAGQADQASEIAAAALTAASEAADSWATAWALHVLALVVAGQGRMTEALPLFERAQEASQAEPTLIDLRILLQINQAVVLGKLDRHDEALASATQARRLASQGGTMVRLAQAHSALAQLLFHAGRWDEAMTEIEAVDAELKEPAAACSDLGIAAMICFHRGRASRAGSYLSQASTHAQRMGRWVVGPLALARSLDRERAGARAEALRLLTAEIINDKEDLEETADLFADGMRLAVLTGQLDTAREIASRASALAAGSAIPHRRASALYCGGLLDRDGHSLLDAARSYAAAGRPLMQAQALEAASMVFAGTGHQQARPTLSRAIEIYAALAAEADVARLRAGS